jgi:hypothetical protein
VNIAAVMAVLRLELPEQEKHALTVLAARAPRGGWALTRSVPAIAADMGCHEATARRALHALCARPGDAGYLEGGPYLQVVHGVGISGTYTLQGGCRVQGVGGSTLQGGGVADSSDTPSTLRPVKRKTGEKQEVAPPDSTQAPSGATVDNDARRVTPSPPRRGGGSSSNGTEPTPRAYLPPSSGSTWQAGKRPHPPECACEGSGWLEVVDDKGRLAVTQCAR